MTKKNYFLSADVSGVSLKISQQKVGFFSHSKLCTTVLILDGLYLIDTYYCSSNSYNGPKKFTHIFAGLTCELRSLVLENPAINQFKHRYLVHVRNSSNYFDIVKLSFRL